MGPWATENSNTSSTIGAVLTLQPHEEIASHGLGSKMKSGSSTHSLVLSSAGTCTQTCGHMTGIQYQELYEFVQTQAPNLQARKTKTTESYVI